MAARLILNADDFGLTRGINRAVEELHQAGVLTSATLMASGPAFEDAVEVAKRNPGLGVGCHVVLADGVPVAAPERIATLLSEDGKSFRPKLFTFLLELARGGISEGEVMHESIAQVRKLQAAGISVTHIDTHKHTHMWPPVARGVLAAAQWLGIRAIRNPFEPEWSVSRSDGGVLRSMQVRLMRTLRSSFLDQPQIASGLVRTTDGTLGIAATGRLSGPTLHNLRARMPDGLWELCCHPGYNDADLGVVRTRLREEREAERVALLAAFPASSSHPLPPHLIHYGDIPG